MAQVTWSGLIEHLESVGLDPKQIVSVELTTDDVAVWAKVTVCALNAEGDRFLLTDRQELATESLLFAVESFELVPR